MTAVTARAQGLSSLIGNTPLIGVRYRYRGREAVIHAKSENLNMTGSVKDRMALHILTAAGRRGDLVPGGLVVEATSGNTGISFAAIGRALGYDVAVFMPDWMSAERVNLIRSFGAAIRLVSREEGGFEGSIRLADALAATTGRAFLPHQFSNRDNSAAHEATTGPEIWFQLQHRNLVPQAFVAGVGTGGTIMGVGEFLRRMRPDILLHPVEPASSPTLSAGRKVGSHRIQGISDEFIPPIVDLGWLNDVLAVHDGDAILMAQKLARELGLAVGISSGANLLAAIEAQRRLAAGAVVVTIFADSNKKYLSTDLMHDEPAREDYRSPEIELLGLDVVGRACGMCENPVPLDVGRHPT